MDLCREDAGHRQGLSPWKDDCPLEDDEREFLQPFFPTEMMDRELEGGLERDGISVVV